MKEVRGGNGGESLNEGYFCKFQLLSKVQTLSHKHLLRQMSNTSIAIGMPQNLHAGIVK